MTNWRGQWLSIKDLAQLMDKSYSTVYRFIRDGTGGIRTMRSGGRIWAHVDESVYDSLTNPHA